MKAIDYKAIFIGDGIWEIDDLDMYYVIDFHTLQKKDFTDKSFRQKSLPSVITDRIPTQFPYM